MPFLVLGLAVLIAVIDQIIKILISTFLKPIGSFEIIPNFFKLDYVENRGAAFGMMADARWIFITFTIIVTAVFVGIVIRNNIKTKLFYASVILIIGGGIGNLIDRIFYGYVIDYLSLSFFPPVCNFADYCITVGAVLLVLYIIFFSDSKNRKLGNKTDE